MRVLIQRVQEASVSVDNRPIGSIGRGLLALVGITHSDSPKVLDKVVDKLIHLRIFEDDQQKMNCSLQDIGGEMLVVSQFTLYGDCSKGRRPSFAGAAPPQRARVLYSLLLKELRSKGIKVQEGEFGAMMHVSLINEGPATFLVEVDGQ